MPLRLPDKWVWDFWLAREGSDYHIFYLQAPRSIGDPELRHWNVSIGHAVSQDLRRWEILPDAIHPSLSSQSWDNYTTWTGCVLRHQGLWYLFYTGTNREEQGRIQRVGLATSLDLINWEKHPQNPLITASSAWYEGYDPGAWYELAWRDPWVFKDRGDGGFHAFLTARTKDGPADGRGVIAHARSDDLVGWEILPPVSHSGEYGHMEVPQWVEIGGRGYLLFSVNREVFSKSRAENPEKAQFTGTYYLLGDQPSGPFRFATEEALCVDEAGSTYAGKVVQNSSGKWLFLCTNTFTPTGEFLGEVSDPFELVIGQDGRLAVPFPR